MTSREKYLLQQAIELIEEQELHIAAEMLPAGRVLVEEIKAALSQQAEPECRCTMRQRLVGDGCCVCNPEYAADHDPIEPAPAQGEREAKAWPALEGIGRDSGHPRAVVLYLRHEPSDGHLRMIQEALRTRPAQTEQQPELSGLTPEGYVEYADYAALEAECKRLSSAHNDASYYAARYEELRAAQTEQLDTGVGRLLERKGAGRY